MDASFYKHYDFKPKNINKPMLKAPGKGDESSTDANIDPVTAFESMKNLHGNQKSRVLTNGQKKRIKSLNKDNDTFQVRFSDEESIATEDLPPDQMEKRRQRVIKNLPKVERWLFYIMQPQSFSVIGEFFNREED